MNDRPRSLSLGSDRSDLYRGTLVCGSYFMAELCQKEGMVRILLIDDPDAKIPNLALMKASVGHKSKGDLVGFDTQDPDLVYISVLFSWNREQAAGLRTMYPNAEVVYGGIGWDLSSVLSPDIELLRPDYDLYPSEYSQGYTTRGCVRNCSFCLIPRKEGRIRVVQHPSQFHDDRFNTCMLMDNNFLAAPSAWIRSIFDWFRDQGIKMDMTQGFDIRLLTEEWAGYLKDIRRPTDLRFAWDDTKDEEIILKGINLLRAAGFGSGHHISFYILAGFGDSTFEDALYRCNRLRELGIGAFVMPYRDKNYRVKDSRILKLAKWANQPTAYWSKPFEVPA